MLPLMPATDMAMDMDMATGADMTMDMGMRTCKRVELWADQQVRSPPAVPASAEALSLQLLQAMLVSKPAVLALVQRLPRPLLLQLMRCLQPLLRPALLWSMPWPLIPRRPSFLCLRGLDARVTLLTLQHEQAPAACSPLQKSSRRDSRAALALAAGLIAAAQAREVEAESSSAAAAPRTCLSERPSGQMLGGRLGARLSIHRPSQ